MAATAESLDPSVSAQETSAPSASEPLNIRILNEPPREYMRTRISQYLVRVHYIQNLCIGSYLEEEVPLPKKIPKPRKDFPAAKVLTRSTVGRIWTRWKHR